MEFAWTPLHIPNPLHSSLRRILWLLSDEYDEALAAQWTACVAYTKSYTSLGVQKELLWCLKQMEHASISLKSSLGYPKMSPNEMRPQSLAEKKIL